MPSGLTATALGEAPTVMVVIRFLVATSSTDTVPAPLLVTYARLPEIATADGEPPVAADPSLTSPTVGGWSTGVTGTVTWTTALA